MTPVSLRDTHQLLGILDAVGHRDLDQHVLAGAHHLLALPEVQLGRRGQDHGIGAFDALGEIAGIVWDAVFLRDLRRRILVAAHERCNLGFGDALERVEMFLAECPLARYADFHCLALPCNSLTRLACCRLPSLVRVLLCVVLPAVARLRAVLALFSRIMWPTAVLEAGTV